MEKNVLKSIENSTDENSKTQVIKKDKLKIESLESSNSTFSFSQSPSLEEIRQRVEKFCNDRNWQQFHTPRNLLLGMMRILIICKNSFKQT